MEYMIYLNNYIDEFVEYKLSEGRNAEKTMDVTFLTLRKHLNI